MQVDIAEEISGRISPLPNVVYARVCVFRAVSFSQSLKCASNVSYLTTGKIPVYLEVRSL